MKITKLLVLLVINACIYEFVCWGLISVTSHKLGDICFLSERKKEREERERGEEERKKEDREKEESKEKGS